MSRPDWGALQQEYIAEYTRSGISPVAWCEARGLNYATARRYIKKTPKNAQTEMCKTAQKSAQKKSAQTAQKRNEKSQEKKPVFDAGLNEGDAEEFSFCPDEFGISDQQAKFAMLVAQGKKPTEAYRLQMVIIAIHCPAQQHLQVHTRILSVLVLIRTPLRLVHMDTPSPLTLLVTRKTPSKTSHLTIL
ncbi:hypothetical protein ESCOCK413M_01730 [Escherichia coli]